MLRSLFLSSTSFLLVVLVGAPGCSDDACGPPKGAQDAGLLASSADVVLNYGNITSGPNNDCPVADAPEGVISLTLQGNQLEGTGLLTLCIPRPDLLQKGTRQLGADVRIIDLSGDKDGCTYTFEQLRPATGDVSVEGMCDNGRDLAGYAITIDGALSLKRTCATMNDTIAVSFTGTVAVEAMP
jgi:hypothetical protein